MYERVKPIQTRKERKLNYYMSPLSKLFNNFEGLQKINCVYFLGSWIYISCLINNLKC